MNKFLQSKVELFKRGRYDELGLFERQVDAMDLLTDSQTTDTLYGGGVRGGKTNLLCKWKLYTRLAYDGSVGMTVREEKTKLEDTTLKSFQQILDEEGAIKGKDYTIDAKFTYHFDNGSTEMFRELKYMPKKDPDFDRIGSYDLTDVAIDEAQQVHFKGYNALKGRLSVLTGKRKVVRNGIRSTEEWRLTPKMLLSCNPSKGWLYSKFYKPSKLDKLPKHMYFIPALATDNPFITKEYIENLKTADPATVQRLLYGNWEYDDDPTALCDYDSILDIFTNDHVQPNGNRIISADLAMQGRDKFIGGHFDGNVGRVDIDMSKSTGRSIEIALKKLKTELRVPNSKIVADADGLGSYLESYIHNIKAFHGGSTAFNRREYANLKSECGFKLAELINKNEIRVIATEEQQEEIATEISTCLKQQSVDKDTMTKRLISKEQMKDDLRRSPDYLDWLIMAMYFKVMPQKGSIKVKVNQ